MFLILKLRCIYRIFGFFHVSQNLPKQEKCVVFLICVRLFFQYKKILIKINTEYIFHVLNNTLFKRYNKIRKESEIIGKIVGYTVKEQLLVERR